VDFGELGMKILSRLFGDRTNNTATATVIFEPTIILPPTIEPVATRPARVPPAIIDVVPDLEGEPLPIEARDWSSGFVAQANAEQKLVEDGCSLGEWEEIPKSP
jgi:hypothetical protein